MLTLHRPRFEFLFLAFTAMFLSGCPTGLGQADTFNKQLAYAYGTHTAVLTAAANAVEAETLGVADAQQVLDLADQSRALLDAAKLAFSVGDLSTADGKLALATNILTQLRDYLNTKVKK